MVSNNPGHLKDFSYRGLHRYSLMHLLIEGTSDNSDGQRFIKAFKQYSSDCCAQTHPRTLWRQHGFEHVLREDELTAEVVTYILRNPVRAGLAATVEEYPFAGSLV
ncbi:MAG: hypothetical protein ABIS29_09435 [Vicinamibacterales bacterium]